jgi:hypothetical protein
MRTDAHVQTSGASPEVKDLLNKTEFGESVSLTE